MAYVRQLSDFNQMGHFEDHEPVNSHPKRCQEGRISASWRDDNLSW